MPNAEKRKELTRQIIIRVKEVIEDMTDAEVVQKMEAAGEQTSLSTVRRFRAAGSENTGFNYNLTVKPFARVFLDLNEAPNDVSEYSTDAEKDFAALDNIIQIKNIQLEALEAQAEDDALKIQFLKDQIAFKEKQMEQKDIQLNERAEYMRMKDEEIARLRKELQAQKMASKVLFYALLVACAIALVVEPLIPLFA